MNYCKVIFECNQPNYNDIYKCEGFKKETYPNDSRFCKFMKYIDYDNDVYECTNKEIRDRAIKKS